MSTYFNYTVVKDKKLQEKVVFQIIACAKVYDMKLFGIAETDFEDKGKKDLEFPVLFIEN